MEGLGPPWLDVVVRTDITSDTILVLGRTGKTGMATR
jgi:hypothetical protein